MAHGYLKSLGSWAGVILTAPVPKEGSTYCQLMGISSPSGKSALADEMLKALIRGVDGYSGIPQHGLRPGSGHSDIAPLLAG